MTCRVCQGIKGREFEAFGRQFSRCGACGTVQRRMSTEEYANLDVTYDSGGWIEGHDPATIEQLLNVEEKVALIERHRPANGRTMLDIGSGMGAYMLAAQKLGMAAVGYEPSLTHSRIARDVFGLNVRNEYFRGTDERFDLILLSHVIEHIFEPAPFLKMVVRSLNPGGRLLVVTPNAAAFSARATGVHWPMLVPKDHVTMLTPNGMKRMTPPGTSMRVSTDEYSYEFMATVGAAIRAKPTSVAGVISPVLTGPTAKVRLLKTALTIASSPIHALAKLTGRQGALIAVIERPNEV